jgi:DNA-directed RNA polymerase subunit RPC12/RpoP
MRDFITGHLDEDPMVLLGEDTWRVMLDASEVFEKERQECQDLLGSIKWASDALFQGLLGLACENCGSPLLRPDPISGEHEEIELECRACGEREQRESFVPTAVSSALQHDLYLSYTDGNETPYVACPYCSEEAYVIEEDRCALCGHEAEHSWPVVSFATHMLIHGADPRSI